MIFNCKCNKEINVKNCLDFYESYIQESQLPGASILGMLWKKQEGRKVPTQDTKKNEKIHLIVH